MVRTIIRDGTIVNAGGTTQADLLIDGETVAGIVAQADPRPEDTVIDASGWLVLPGLVDAHTHIQLDTGLYQTADNWEVGTKAAAAGGVTSVIDFANQLKGKPFAAALATRRHEAADAIIDYAFHMVILDPARNPNQLEADLEGLLELGISSVKLFTTYRPNYFLDDADLLRVFEALPDGMLAMVHAENDAIVTHATGRLVAEGKTGWQYHAQGRPDVAEIEAARRVINLASLTAGHPQVYIAHCSTSETVDSIHNRRQHYKAYCETCPQYLLLDDSVYDEDKPEHFILQPPLRRRSSQIRSLRKMIQMGWVDVISTDSCDYSLAQKQEHRDFTKTPGGLPGVETLLPLMYTLFCDQLGEPVHKIIKLMTANPARIFGLYPRKGALNVGSDADVVLYDPRPEGTITHTDLHYVAGYSPYEGMRVKGRVMMTLSRGEVVYRYGADDPFGNATPGRGQFVPGAPLDAMQNSTFVPAGDRVI